MEQQNPGEFLKLTDDQQVKMADRNWNVLFSYKDRSISVTLKNGEDVLRIGELFAEWLTSQGIEVIIDKQ